MQTLILNREGFITDYLVSGPQETDFIDTTVDDNQLHYEKYLRSIIADKHISYPAGQILAGQPGRTGMPWRYHYGQGNWFVDFSTFYSSLKRIELDAATILISDKNQDVTAILWTYAAVDIWCNGKLVCKTETPVYKPIIRIDMQLPLHQGENELYIVFQNLGVRDTRNLFGIQIPRERTGISVSLPDIEHTTDFINRAQWLSALKLNKRTIVFPSPAPEGTRIGTDSMSPDYADVKTRISVRDVSGEDLYQAQPGKPDLIVICNCRGEHLSRRFEIAEDIVPHYNKYLSPDENSRRIYTVIAGVQSLDRGEKYGFAVPNILARKAVHLERSDDRAALLNNLGLINNRYDCSDFLVSGLIRYIHNYDMDKELAQQTEQVLLNYRYWMTQKGSDAMCFWSENHSLLFYSNAMFAGKLYPDKYFPRAGMTGIELYEFGRKMTDQWLSDVEQYGFEEFLSTVYMCVTFAGLLNVIDYADKDLSERTRKITDTMVQMLSRHMFKGVIIAPMGRVYREIIYPFIQGAQALMNMVNPNVPDSYGEGWLAWYATSSYKFPDDLRNLMDSVISAEYSTGNALVRLEKQADYCMTSVQSAREDDGFKRWKNLTLEPGSDNVSHAYTKSLNERFHGTTCFEPGVYGYQQHMWSAAIDTEVQVFTNHPGGTIDSSSMRPGYWYGNGVMPAIKQIKNCIGVIYCIPEEHPIHFTHLFWPTVKFTRTQKTENWLFGMKGNGLVGVWCSTQTESFDDQLENCEYRAYGDEMAWVCICGSISEYKSFEEFCSLCQSLQPVYSSGTKTLKIPDRQFQLCFKKHKDATQYI